MHINAAQPKFKGYGENIAHMNADTDSQKLKIRTKLKSEWLTKGGGTAVLSAEVPQVLFSQRFSTHRHLADTHVD